MRSIIATVMVLALVGWFAWGRTQQASVQAVEPTQMSPTMTYQCEGKTHCSQMQSCEEAMFYLKNCPGTEMDGDNDGVPCEGQWCGR
jgi:hypothetical protein